MTGRHGAALLPGDRLHLHHGPIDLVIGWDGPGRGVAFGRAEVRFATVLDELATELPVLRRPVEGPFRGSVAGRMAQAVAPHSAIFVTPMAAVAGAVADEILGAMSPGQDVAKAYVNNGGDIACHLSGQAVLKVLGASGDTALSARDAPRGIATSGWRGRSQSRGIADAVTVLAPNAAAADVAATLVANAVDLPGHAAIARAPAHDIFPDSDLGSRLVTTGVDPLPPHDVAEALASGRTVAAEMAGQGLIHAATLTLQGQTVTFDRQPAYA